MSVYLYDQALVERLREITGDDRIHVIDPDQSVSFFAQFDKDKVDYPALVVSRGPVTLLDYRNQAVALKGQTATIDNDNYVVKSQLVPMRIEWSIDVFAVDRYTCDEILRELVFYFIINPRFEVKVPYGLNIVQNFDILVSPNLVDNSDLLEFPNRGEFFRETMTVYTENAHLFYSKRQYQVFGTSDVDTVNNKGVE